MRYPASEKADASSGCCRDACGYERLNAQFLGDHRVLPNGPRRMETGPFCSSGSSLICKSEQIKYARNGRLHCRVAAVGIPCLGFSFPC